MIFNYHVKHSHGEASGQIDAKDREEAEKVLSELFAPEKQDLKPYNDEFYNDRGEKVYSKKVTPRKREIIDLTIREV